MLVLQAVSFINDQVAPGELGKCGLFNIANLVSGNNHMPVAVLVPLTWFQDSAYDIVARSLVSVELDSIQSWSPPSEFIHPVAECTLRNNNEVRSADATVFHHVNQNGDSLKSLQTMGRVNKKMPWLDRLSSLRRTRDLHDVTVRTSTGRRFSNSLCLPSAMWAIEEA